MKSNFTYEIIQSAIKKGYTIYLVDTESGYTQTWENIKQEMIREQRKNKIEELFPELKNND
jgi:iron uptake system EfeUOB component EfeO/EfeM